MNTTRTAQVAFDALHADVLQRVYALGDTPELRELRAIIEHDLPQAVHQVALETERCVVAEIKRLANEAAQHERDRTIASAT